jgi:hypothetical protein
MQRAGTQLPALFAVLSRMPLSGVWRRFKRFLFYPYTFTRKNEYTEYMKYTKTPRSQKNTAICGE